MALKTIIHNRPLAKAVNMYDFNYSRLTTMCGSQFVLSGFTILFMLFVFIYAYWCSTRFPYQMMLVSFIINTMVVTYGAGTVGLSGAPAFTPGFVWGWCCSILRWFVDRCLSFCLFSFGHCVVCPSSIYGFWLLLWYLQAFLKTFFLCVVSSMCVYRYTK